MNSKLFWILSQLGNRLWIRAAVFCLLGIAIALLGVAVKDKLPQDLSYKIGAGSVDDILNIIASSMLAVTTFSLSIMVSAYATASAATTPRVTQLLLSDTTSQNALSVFIGAFLFSLAGIITLKIGIYGDNGRLVLFIVTITVILSIVIMLLRWIDHLSRLGRIGHTIDMVESASRTTISRHIKRPLMGCSAMPAELPKNTNKIKAKQIGYIQNIDTGKLDTLARKYDTAFYLTVRPGFFNDGMTPLLHSTAALDDDAQQDVLDAFTIGDLRSFTQDPRYCMIVLSEIASRALSPAVNDPGTAIDIIGTQLRLLAPLSDSNYTADDDCYAHVFAPALDMQDVIDDAFMAIARDGAGMFEVCMRLQKALSALAASNNAALAHAARTASARALSFSDQALVLDSQKEQIKATAPV